MDVFDKYDGHLEFYYFKNDIMGSKGQMNTWNKFRLRTFKLAWFLLLAISIVLFQGNFITNIICDKRNPLGILKNLFPNNRNKMGAGFGKKVY